MRSLPLGIRGACLNSSQSAVETAFVCRQLLERRVDILFISPERLASSSFKRLAATQLPASNVGEERRRSMGFPPVGLAVIDEAHCVAEWSHAFRPSYLRLGRLLRDGKGTGVRRNQDQKGDDENDTLGEGVVRARAVLALTATATRRTAEEICRVLRIDTGGYVNERQAPTVPFQPPGEQQQQQQGQKEREEGVRREKGGEEGEGEDGVYFGGWRRPNLR